MKTRTKTLSFLFLLMCSLSFGQMGEYNFKRELKGVSDHWHKITLPDVIFGKTSQELDDIRIFGITPEKDTIEAPYFIRIENDKKSTRKKVVFKTLNTSYNAEGYYFTFEIPTSEAINKINLNFAQNNFDWQVKLEGSQNQNDWYTIVDDYRILSINNGQTNFKYTELTFPTSKYRFFRVLIKSKEKPTLRGASITQNEQKQGKFREYSIEKFEQIDDRKTKQTVIDINLQIPTRINHLNIDVKDTFDYYRPVTIKYLLDSMKTEKGWIYNYRTLTTGTLNSIVKKDFDFSSTTVKKLKVLIDNESNQPLTINSVQLKGKEYQLVARFIEDANYFLTYGNRRVRSPKYDIDHFKSKIPKMLNAITLGEEVPIEKEVPAETEPLFKNKAWLWIIMGVIILLLGGFTIGMIRK